jgi:predicted dehydrogenase
MTVPVQERAKLIAERWQALFDQKLRVARGLEFAGNRLKMVIEGTGDWVIKAYRPALFRVAEQGVKLDVTYVYNSAIQGVVAPSVDDRWKEELKDRPKATWEQFIDKSCDFELLRKDKPDAVFVVTPDKTHCTIATEWLRWAPLIFVEKPFDVSPSAVEALIAAHGDRDGMNVLGVDHYQLYATPMLPLIGGVVEALGGAITDVEFLMCEHNGVETERIPTLQLGLTMDLLCHLLALLLPFTDLNSLDAIDIPERARYRTPAGSPQFGAETFSRTTFTAADCIDQTTRFPCRATVGKGLQQAVKYIQLLGANGRSLRIDFLKREKDALPWSRGQYPLESMFLTYAAGERGSGFIVNDPYRDAGKLHIIAPSVFGPNGRTPTDVTLFERLFVELARGGNIALSSTLLMRDAEPLVRFLDRLWSQMRTLPIDEYEFQLRNPMVQGLS